jgi:hypothetical protein
MRTRRKPMRPALYRSLAVAALATPLITATACHHHHHGRHLGPAEHAGHHVDRAADKAGDAVEDAGRAVNRALPGD